MPSIIVSMYAVGAITVTSVTVVLGSMAVTPAAVTGIGSTTTPTINQGDVSVDPDYIVGIGSAVNPTVLYGDAEIRPPPAEGIGLTDVTVVGGVSYPIFHLGNLIFRGRMFS